MIGRRIGDPFARLEDSIKKNPLGADRQRTDLKVLASQNRNPRIHDLTPADLARSQTYTPAKEDPAAINDQIVRLKAEAYHEATDLSFAESMSRINGDLETLSAPSSFCPQETVNETTFEIYKNSKFSSAPITFGHRPGSASRMFNPSDLTEHHTNSNGLHSKGGGKERKVEEKEILRRGSGMSSQLLYHLLNQPQCNKKDKHDAVRVEKSTSQKCGTAADKNDSAMNENLSKKGKFRFKLGHIDSSLYEVWKDNNNNEWDKLSATHGEQENSTPLPLSGRKQPQTEQKNNAASKRAQQTDIYEPFGDFSRPNWKVEVDQLFPPQRRRPRRLSKSSREVRKILQERNERKKELDKRVKLHEQLIQMERVERIKDRLTMPSDWERIMECR